MRRGRRPAPCPNSAKLRELVEGGALIVDLMEHFGKDRKAVTRWCDELGLDPRARIPNLPGEEWLPVVGWEGEYEVSNQGRIKTMAHVSHDGRTIPGRLRTLNCMSGTHSRRPYWQVQLFRGGRGAEVYRAKVHRLVMEAFVGPVPNGMEICHINGNGFDNRLENLRYDTHRKNMADLSVYDRPKVCASCHQPLHAE